MTATQDIRTTTYDNILVERDAPIATITLNRPEKRNALSVPLMEELIAAFAAIGRDKTIQAVILAANGPAFSAGHDLSELVDGDINAYRHVFDVCTHPMTTIQAIPHPVIARVHKNATPARRPPLAPRDPALA